MIKITIEGPIAAGKTHIGNALRDILDEIGMTWMNKENSTEAAITQHKPNVLIEERQIR